MKFSEFKYQRPDVALLKQKFLEQLNLIGADNDFKVEIKAIESFLQLSDDLDTLVQLVYIRNSIDTTDPFYEGEREFLDVIMPELEGYDNIFQNNLLKSKNRVQLEKKFGSLIFKKAETKKKTFSPEIIPLLQAENKEATKYRKLIASAKIPFDNKVLNLSQMAPYISSKDRETRHQAQLAVSKFFADNKLEFDQIYDNLVQTRHQIALALGYQNFVQLGYDRMERTDYNSDDVKKYRDQVYQQVVPLAKRLTAKKAKRFQIDDLKSYDLSLTFLSGNPKPKGNKDWQVSKAKQMYSEMSPETDQFFNYMLDNELLDLDSKPGKEAGGYCTYIANYKAPFIFANFNGTKHDVDVLTHEAGHAFQVYQSKDLIKPYRWPTFEAAEIHSMSMEFLAWPWINNFFEDDTNKYKYSHLESAILFLPYGVLVDEFQHEVYSNPGLTAEQRRAVWRNLEKKYLPYKDYDDDKFLDEGGYFFRQGHIFEVPFYYIDYTLAQVVAFEYWGLSQQDYQAAWNSYLALCKLGGSDSFTGLIKQAGLHNPFKEGTIKKIIDPIVAFLDGFDDESLK